MLNVFDSSSSRQYTCDLTRFQWTRDKQRGVQIRHCTARLDCGSMVQLSSLVRPDNGQAQRDSRARFSSRRTATTSVERVRCKREKGRRQTTSNYCFAGAHRTNCVQRVDVPVFREARRAEPDPGTAAQLPHSALGSSWPPLPPPPSTFPSSNLCPQDYSSSPYISLLCTMAPSTIDPKTLSAFENAAAGQ